jgi:hypothetical protein
MLTIEKINTYIRYRGFLDGYVLLTKRSEDLISGEDWVLIQEIIQDLNLINKGLTSGLYTEEVNKKIIDNCDSLETQKRLKEIPTLMEEYPDEWYPPKI